MDELRLDKRSHGPEFLQDDEVVVYAKDDGTLHVVNSDATDTELGAGGEGGGSVPGSLQYAAAQIDNAQFLALATTDVEIVDAPGAGKAIWLRSVSAVMDSRNGAYGTGAGFDAELSIGFAGDWKALSFVDPTSGTLSTFSRNEMWSSSGDDLSDIENVPLCIGNVGSNFTDGGAGNTFSIAVWYYVVDLVPFTE